MKTTRSKASRSLNTGGNTKKKPKLPREKTLNRDEVRRETTHRQGHTK